MSNISTLEIENASKRVLYTDEEDKVIADFIAKQSYKNLAQAFELFAVNALNVNNRSVKSLQQRYHNHLKHKHKMFVIANSGGGMDNVKYSPRDTIPNYKPIEVIMRQLLDIDPTQRQKILDFFI